MGEKIYKTMKSAGILNLVMGIIVMVTGVAAGILIIINGAKLLKDKSSVLF